MLDGGTEDVPDLRSVCSCKCPSPRGHTPAFCAHVQTNLLSGAGRGQLPAVGTVWVTGRLNVPKLIPNPGALEQTWLVGAAPAVVWREMFRMAVREGQEQARRC